MPTPSIIIAIDSIAAIAAAGSHACVAVGRKSKKQSLN